MAIRSEVVPHGFIEGIGPGLGYEYLGPGTDIHYKTLHNVVPADDLDYAAMLHDKSYAKIKSDYRRGLITRAEADMATDSADFRLFKGSASDFYAKKAPEFVGDVAKVYGGPLGTGIGVGQALKKPDLGGLAVRTGSRFAVPALEPLWQARSGYAAIKSGLRAMPSGVTAAVMLGKLGLSKLGLIKSGYVGLPYKTPYDEYLNDLRVSGRRSNEEVARQYLEMTRSTHGPRKYRK